MQTTTPTVAHYLAYWLREIVEPSLAPKTYDYYEMFSRLYIAPDLGAKRLDRLQVRDVRSWLNGLRQACQCCVQGKDAARPLERQRCCAIGKCCGQRLSERTIKDARDTLRAALANAVAEELLTRNVATVVRLARTTQAQAELMVRRGSPRLPRIGPSTTRDPLYAAYVLVLVLGLRRGEALGLTWDDINLDAAEVAVTWQLQRCARTAPPSRDQDAGLRSHSAATRHLPDRPQAPRGASKPAIGPLLGTSGKTSGSCSPPLYGTPYEPRNFARHFALRCKKAGVRYIKVHDTRRTCGSLLAALDVHPRVAMQILRHSKIAITMEIYTEVPDARTRDALRRLGDQLDG